MLKKWLQGVFIEAWKTYTEEYPVETTAMRDPTDADTKSRLGCIWTNKITKKRFVYKAEWKVMGE